MKVGHNITPYPTDSDLSVLRYRYQDFGTFLTVKCKKGKTSYKETQIDQREIPVELSGSTYRNNFGRVEIDHTLDDVEPGPMDGEVVHEPGLIQVGDGCTLLQHSPCKQTEVHYLTLQPPESDLESDMLEQKFG